MQTSAIAYRVADFLRQHPPFQYIDEADLIALVGRGRVKFHDVDEYICWQGAAHKPFFFVIQQGSVSLWDETADPPVLCDIRGAGDIIGIERFNGSPKSLYSAKAASEVVVYAIHPDDFAPLLDKYPRAAQYVAAYSAVTAHYSAPGESLRPDQMFVADLARGTAPVCCPASATVQEAAALLVSRGAQSVGIHSGNQLLGLLTSTDLVNWIAAGATDPLQPACNLAKPVHTVPPQISVSDCVLAMSEARAVALLLTSDGTPRSAPQANITGPTLAPAFGDHPLNILDEIAAATHADALRALNSRARAFIRQNLSAPGALDWLSNWADIVNSRILERLVDLTGNDAPDTVFCFCGAAGRREILTAAMPQVVVIGALRNPIETVLTDCGYVAPQTVMTGSLDEWKRRFSGWVGDPIMSEVYESRALFDLRPVTGPADVFEQLAAHVRAEVASRPVFVRILANDCLTNLPPLTFFQDHVVEESGEQSDTFRLESSTLQPLVDVARVLGLACGAFGGDSTASRFQVARRRLSAGDAVLREAADTIRVALFHQARAGLRLNSTGGEIPLPALSRHDRQALKSGFRSIHNLLKFAAPGDWLEAL